MSDFDNALQKVLVSEGGWSDNPKDPGGATMKGVTQRVYDDYRKGAGKTLQSVRYISSEELRTIYKRRYWDLFKGDEMPAGVSYVVFDGAVNSGVSQSVKWLQRALRPAYTGAIDGLAGDGTLRALAASNNHAALIASISAQRLAFLKSLKTWPTFGRGWSARVADVQRIGQAWAAGSATLPVPVITSAESAKAPVSDAAAPPPVAPGDLAAGGGGVAAVIAQTIGQLAPLQAIPSVANIVVWLTVAGALIAVAGIAYRFWAAHRRHAIRQATA